MSTLIHLRGGHSTFLPDAIPTEVARQIEEARTAGHSFTWFHQIGDNATAINPYVVVAIHKTGD